MSIKSYTIKAIGAFATVAALTACSNAPTPSEKEKEAMFGSFFDKGNPEEAVGSFIPFGANNKGGVVRVKRMEVGDGTNLCLIFSSLSAFLDESTQYQLKYCRPVKKIETGPAVPTSHP